MAIAAFVLAIISLLIAINPCSFGIGILPAVPALILGIISYRRAKREGQPPGMSLAAIIMAPIVLALSLLFLLVMLSFEFSLRPRAQGLVESNNLRQISVALLAYRDAYGSYPLPPAGIDLPERDQDVTAAIFEMLALEQQLPYRLFRGSRKKSPLDREARQDVAEIWRSPNPDWAHTFALDWTAPLMLSAANRPLMASRYPLSSRVAVAFIDLRVQDMPVQDLDSQGRARLVENQRGTENFWIGDEHQSPEEDRREIAGGKPSDRAWLR